MLACRKVWFTDTRIIFQSTASNGRLSRSHSYHPASFLRCFLHSAVRVRKCQEPPRTDKSQTPTNADLQSTCYSTLPTKLDTPRRTLPTIRGRWCSRRMAHSDFYHGRCICTKYFSNFAGLIEHRLRDERPSFWKCRTC